MTKQVFHSQGSSIDWTPCFHECCEVSILFYHHSSGKQNNWWLCTNNRAVSYQTQRDHNGKQNGWWLCTKIRGVSDQTPRDHNRKLSKHSQKTAMQKRIGKYIHKHCKKLLHRTSFFEFKLNIMERWPQQSGYGFKVIYPWRGRRGGWTLIDYRRNWGAIGTLATATHTVWWPVLGGYLDFSDIRLGYQKWHLMEIIRTAMIPKVLDITGSDIRHFDTWKLCPISKMLIFGLDIRSKVGYEGLVGCK